MNDKILKNITRMEEGVFYMGKNALSNKFENDYLSVREKEGRVFSDVLVEMLPYLPKQDPLHTEWLQRSATLKSIVSYLKKGKQQTTILDLGCGNGWFSNRLSNDMPDLKIYAIDVNTQEVMQAARLFKNCKITFIVGDIFDDNYEYGAFNIIIINSVIQYFPNIKHLINRLFELLPTGGEIHIIDSPIYKTEYHKQEAQKRSKLYFSQLGQENMIDNYHHHTYDSLEEFSPTILHNPNNMKRKILTLFGKKINPFPWIRINKK